MFGPTRRLGTATTAFAPLRPSAPALDYACQHQRACQMSSSVALIIIDMQRGMLPENTAPRNNPGFFYRELAP
jgi:hypothetical protein